MRLPNGITPLTGSGVNIGQVEILRPGWPVQSVGPDDMEHSNQFVQPFEVVIGDGTAALEPDEDINVHATQVAGVMISKDTEDSSSPANDDDPRGVAPDASLYASAYIVPGGGVGPYGEALLSTQHIAQRPNMRAINHSWQKPRQSVNAPLDGNSQLTLGMDWIASRYDVLNVIAGNQGEMQPLPKDNFNGMTIGASSMEGGVYRRVASFNTFDEDADGDRTSISLLAPGDGIETSTFDSGELIDQGTSFAAPHVVGTVALLQQYAEAVIPSPGWDEDARKHEVMKAVLMNSADKIEDDGTVCPKGCLLGMERTVLDLGPNQDGQNRQTWLQSEAYTGPMKDALPLDDQMGAGHLNAKRALQQFSAGEQDFNAGPVSLVGWDFGLTDGQDEFNKYVLDTELPANQFVSLTLAWDREVFFEIDNDADNEYDIGDTFLEFAEPIDLNLYLMPAGETDIEDAVASSIATDTSVEHIFFEIDTAGMYEIWVGQDSGGFAQQTYALAWWMEAIDEPVVTGDYDGNGSVGPEDYDIWKANFGTSFAAADGNGNGVVDAADYTVWRDNLGAGSGSVSAVPEPSSLALLLVGISFVGRRRVLGKV